MIAAAAAAAAAAAKTASRTSGGQRRILSCNRIPLKRCYHASYSNQKSTLGVVPATNMHLSNVLAAQSSYRQPRASLFEEDYEKQNHQQQQQQEPPQPKTTETPPLSTTMASSPPSKKKGPSARMATALPQSPDGKKDTTTTTTTTTTKSKWQMMEALATTAAAFDHDNAAFDPNDLVDMDQLKRLASLKPTPLRLGDMYKFGASKDPAQRLRNAQFLLRELPIRFAQRAYDLLSLPYGLSRESTPIRQVALMYTHYIRQFDDIPMPQTAEDEDRFTQFLHGLILDRTTIPTTIAKGLMEWSMDHEQQQRGGDDFELDRQQEMEDALERFFTARVGLRFLTEHHILSAPRNHPTLYNYVNAPDVVRQMEPMMSGIHEEAQTISDPNNNNNNNNNDSEVKEDRGCIQYDCNAVLECQKVAQGVARQTEDCYGICPEIEIIDRQSKTAQVFTYVPHHLQYMLAELLKNSCRASVERYMKEGGKISATAKVPPVRVVIVKGKNEVTIKVSDQGGGIPRSTMARIFNFAHSTAKQAENDTEFGTVEAGIQHLRGFGLPLARIYARYFGGELTLKSMEGYGLDAYLYLPRLGDACENLPKRVLFSPGEQVSLPSPKKKDATKKQQKQ